MEIWTFGIPTTVALAAVAILGYLIGRSGARRTPVSNEQAHRELKRARSIIRELETISQQVRQSLASHHRNVVKFKERVKQINGCSEEEAWRELSEEAERMLKPTLKLSNQISHAYDEIRQQTNLLMTFTEVRTDPLTGLRNRRALDESLESLFSMMSRYSLTFSVAIFDLDYFKRINDEQGHLQGDHILQQVARLFDDCVRDTDVVVRFGGEEFLVVMPETELQGACIFSERARKEVEEQLSITISGGVAQALDGDDTKTLLSRADSALYAAKSAGRNFVFRHTGHVIEPYGDREPIFEYDELDENTGDPASDQKLAEADPPVKGKQPGVEQPSVEQPSVEQPSVEQPGVEQPSVDESSDTADAETVELVTAPVVDAAEQEGAEYCEDAVLSELTEVSSLTDRER